MRLGIASALLLTCLAFGGMAIAENENKWVRVKGGTWEPSTNAIAGIKRALQPYIKEQAKLQGRNLMEWREYTFQYQGVDENGRKYVFINALCRPDPKWKLEDDFRIVFDGGPCYFHLKYDPARGQFVDLMINGEA